MRGGGSRGDSVRGGGIRRWGGGAALRCDRGGGFVWKFGTLGEGEEGDRVWQDNGVTEWVRFARGDSVAGLGGLAAPGCALAHGACLPSPIAPPSR